MLTLCRAALARGSGGRSRGLRIMSSVFGGGLGEGEALPY